MDWEDLLVGVGVVLLLAAAWLMYGLPGVLALLGGVLVSAGLWIAACQHNCFNQSITISLQDCKD